MSWPVLFVSVIITYQNRTGLPLPAVRNTICCGCTNVACTIHIPGSGTIEGCGAAKHTEVENIAANILIQTKSLIFLTPKNILPCYLLYFLYIFVHSTDKPPNSKDILILNQTKTTKENRCLIKEIKLSYSHTLRIRCEKYMPLSRERRRGEIFEQSN